MPRFFLLALFALVFCACAKAPVVDSVPVSTPPQNHYLLHLTATVPEGTGTVYVAGSLPVLGGWSPNHFAMEGTGTRREATIEVPAGVTIEFKLTAGSWDLEALAPDGTIPQNTVIEMTRNTEYSILVPAFGSRAAIEGSSAQDPERFAKEIAEFEQHDLESPPPPDAVLAIGSSSMRYWHDTIANDLAPLPIIPRGFGGSTLNDVLYFTDRIVLPYAPRAILLYEGDNDLTNGVTPEEFIEQFHAFVDRVNESLPETHIYTLAVKPSPSRWELWPRFAKTNELLAKACAENPRLTFIDIATPMLTDGGKPGHDLFRDDLLHMNEKGYAIWTATVRPVLLKDLAGK